MSMEMVRSRSAEVKERLSEVISWLSGISEGGIASPEKMTEMRFRFGSLQQEQKDLYRIISLQEQMCNESPENVFALHEEIIRESLERSNGAA
jgi:hypothetical protein